MTQSATSTAHSPLHLGNLLAEAREYYHEARRILATTHVIDHMIYADSGITQQASVMAFLSALKAIDCYALARKYARVPVSIEEYMQVVAEMPPPLGRAVQMRLTVVYQNLHLLAYQAGGVEVEAIKSGFRRAKEIVDAIENHMTRKSS